MSVKTRLGALCLLLCLVVFVHPAGAQEPNFTDLQLSLDDTNFVSNQEAGLLVSYLNEGEWPAETTLVFYVSPGVTITSQNNDLSEVSRLSNANLIAPAGARSPNFAWEIPTPETQSDIPQVHSFRLSLESDVDPAEFTLTAFLLDPSLDLPERVLAGPANLTPEDFDKMFAPPADSEEDTPEPSPTPVETPSPSPPPADILPTDTVSEAPPVGDTVAQNPPEENTPEASPQPPEENTPENSQQLGTTTDDTPPQTIPTYVWIILIVVGLVVIIAVIGFIVWRLTRKPAKKQSPTPTSHKRDTPTPTPPVASRSKPTQPYLTLADAPQTRFLLQASQTTLGRSEDNDLVIDEKFPNWNTVSRRHAVILQQGEDFYIQDLESRNGLRVDGRATMKNLLRDGWQVSLGGVEFIFHSGGNNQ